jgi:hypothetical protein
VRCGFLFGWGFGGRFVLEGCGRDRHISEKRVIRPCAVDCAAGQSRRSMRFWAAFVQRFVLHLGTNRYTIRLYSMVAKLTKSQESVRRFLEERSENGEPPPTYREISRRFGYKSPRAASDHVAALEKKGIVTHT